MGRSHARVSVLVSAVLAAVALAGCGGSGDAGQDGWTFTDDIGTRIELDEAPERIVAQVSVAAALTDLGLGDRIVGTFGPLEDPDGKPDLQADGLDPESVEDVTGAGEYGELDLEEIAGLEPDLVVTSTYGDEVPWYIGDAAKKKLDKAYQTAMVSFDGEELPGIFDNIERLAEALGADPADFEEGRTAFADAATRLQEAAEAAGDPSFVAVAPSQDSLYVSNPGVNPDLKHFRDELGLDIVTPDPSDVDEGGYWQTLSWENADTHDADVALWDVRGGSASLTMLQDQPVWGRTTAAKADAYLPWQSVTPPSAAAVARAVDRFAERLEALED